eukprot:6420343-Prymnesium_polylepis.1
MDRIAKPDRVMLEIGASLRRGLCGEWVGAACAHHDLRVSVVETSGVRICAFCCASALAARRVRLSYGHGSHSQASIERFWRLL